MAKRITIVLDDDLVAKLRTIQAKQIKDTSQTVSFSSVINDMIAKSLKK